MHAFAVFLIRAVMILFFIGLAGSAVVIVISFFEDWGELFGPDEPTIEAKPNRPHEDTSVAVHSYTPSLQIRQKRS
jgi:hypothetical protein